MCVCGGGIQVDPHDWDHCRIGHAWRLVGNSQILSEIINRMYRNGSFDFMMSTYCVAIISTKITMLTS